jgi:hypothetical protein
MRIALCLALAAFALAGSAAAQGPAVGRLEIRAYQPIPKTKVAVQLGSDTHLSRELRRLVMIRLSRRGNEVGFSGGNVMRMDVSFFDFGGGGGPPMVGGQPSYAEPGANPRPEMPANRLERRDGGLSIAPPASTLRITLSLYTVDGGKVLWTASSSCPTQASMAMRAGEAMIDTIFDDADKNRVGDAGCPL